MSRLLCPFESNEKTAFVESEASIIVSLFCGWLSSEILKSEINWAQGSSNSICLRIWVDLWVDGGSESRNWIELFCNHLISLEFDGSRHPAVDFEFSMDEGVQFVDFRSISVRSHLSLGKEGENVKFNKFNIKWCK